MDKVKVAILFGSCSEEHDVSVKSAIEIAANIDTEKYEPIYIGITKSIVWKLCEKPCAEWENCHCCSAVLSPDKNMHGLIVLKDKEYEIRRIDAAFSVLHGKSGEDGSIQGLFELSGIPFVDCDIQSSAICDKSLAYILANNAGITTPEYWVIHNDDNPAPDAFPFACHILKALCSRSLSLSEAGVEIGKIHAYLIAAALAKHGRAGDFWLKCKYPGMGVYYRDARGGGHVQHRPAESYR